MTSIATMMGAVLVLSLSSSASDPAIRAKRTLGGCGVEEQALAARPDGEWLAIPAKDDDHVALRTAAGAAMPHARTMILLATKGGHLATTENSIILVRSGDARWHGSAVSRTTTWIGGASPATSILPEWTVSPTDGKRIDAILRDRCFAAEPTVFPFLGGGPPPLGASDIRIDAITRHGRRSVSFLSGTARGLTAELLFLIRPR